MKSIGIKRESTARASNDARPPASVFLIRHANTALNSPDPGKEKIRGHLNPPLDASGVQQSKDIAQNAVKTIGPDVVLSSDLQRAAHTADQIAQAQGTETYRSHMFRPWDLGNLQGRPVEDAVPVINEHAKPENRDKDVAGGESFNDFADRFLGGLEKTMQHVRSTGQSVAIVTHYRDLKLAQAWLDGDMKDFDLNTFAKNDTPTGSVMRIFPKGPGWDWEIKKDVQGAAEKGRDPEGKAQEAAAAGNGAAGGRAG